jgi:hypothetical protein
MNVKLGAAFLVGVLVLAQGEAPAQGKPASAVKKFRFKAGKIETGRVYAYDRYDPAGGRAGSVLVYVPDRKRVEIFRAKAGAGEGQLFTGEMNWETFTLRSFELSKVSRDGTTTRQATGTFGEDVLAVSVEDPALYRGAEGAATFTVPLPAIPAHLYSLDLITLGLALRHVADPAGSVEVGVLTENPKVGPQSPNLFVAAFIGTPPMNFVKATIADGGATLKGAAFSLPVAQSYRALTAGKDGKALVVGIRAENLSDGSRPVRGESARIPVTVEIAEPLGHEVLVYARAGGDDLIVAKVDPHHAPAIDQKLELVVELESLHLFDAATERRLTA